MADLTEELTVRQAYFVMFEYLRRYYERGKSDEVGGMLGNLSLLADGGSADPTALADFLDSVDAVMREERRNGYGDADFKLLR